MDHTSASLLADFDIERDPIGALVHMWHVCGQQEIFQCGLDRERCEGDADRFYVALTENAEMPVVAPAAALKALDEYCFDLRAALPSDRVPQISVGDPPVVYFLLELRSSRGSKYAERRPNFRQYWVRHHQLIPAKHEGVQIDVRAVFGKVDLAYPVSAVVGGFEDAVEPRWLNVSGYLCAELTDSEARWRSVQELLDVAREQGAQVIVLPELTIDRVVLERLQAWLQETERHDIQLVAAGSFHVQDPNTLWRNRTWLLGKRGHVLLCHDKIQPFRHASGQDELIAGGSLLRLLLCGVGVVAPAICLDFCEIAPAPVATLWAQAGPDLVLLPSMGEENTNASHQQRARELAAVHGTRVLLASQHPDRPTAVGIAMLPNVEPQAAAPVIMLTLR